jgi:hypothetical protein
VLELHLVGLGPREVRDRSLGIPDEKVDVVVSLRPGDDDGIGTVRLHLRRSGGQGDRDEHDEKAAQEVNRSERR